MTRRSPRAPIRLFASAGAAVVLLVAGSAHSSEAPAPTVDDPDVLTDAAVDSHPSLESLRTRVEALRYAGTSARLWSDPMLGGELSNLPITSPTLGSHPMAGVQLKIQQRFPAPGEPAARAALADARVREAEGSVEEAANALRGEVRSRYWDLTVVRQLRGVTREHVVELDGMLEAVRARYEVGVAEQHDLLQLQLRRDRLVEDLIDLDAREAGLLASLNGALARPPSSAIGTPSTNEIAQPEGDAESRLASLETHPAVLARRAVAGTGRAAAHRARIEARPEPTAWLGYRIRAPITGGDDGTNFVTAGVSVPLPFASTRRWRAAEKTAQAQARAADQAADGTLQRLTARLAASEARYERAGKRAVTYRDQLLPAARTTLDSTLAAYPFDRASFADLIRASIDVLAVERTRLQAEVEAAAALAEIQTLVGHSSPSTAEAQ